MTLRRLAVIAVVAVLSLVVVPTGASAVNDYTDGGNRLEAPAGADVTFYFDPVSSAPYPNSEYKSDVRWAFDEWDDHPDGFPFAQQEGSSNDYNLNIQWKEIAGNALASTTVYIIGGVGQCGDVAEAAECTLVFDNDPDGSYVWETNGASLGSLEYDFRSTALHEAGHVLGLGHSQASLRYNTQQITPESVIVMGVPGEPDDYGKTHDINKDDCASANFQFRGDAVCNRTITRTWGSMTRYGIDSTSSTPRYFHGWGFSSAWQYVSCESTDKGFSTDNCHWRMRPYPGTTTGDFGVIYDVEGAGDDWGGSLDDQGMREGTDWRVRVQVGAPDDQTNNVEFKLCLYMRDEGNATLTNTWKNGKVCTAWIALPPDTDWTWVSTSSAGYELPADAGDDRYLRTYIYMKDTSASLYVSQWEVERIGNP